MINTYYILENGAKTGPYSYDDLIERGLDFDTQIAASESDDWENASDRPEFFHYFESRGLYFPTEDNLAGFGWRLIAYVADSFILAYPLNFLRPINLTEIYERVLSNTSTQDDMMVMLKTNLFSFVIVTLYHTACEISPLQGSFGKKIFRLVVVNADGQRLSLGRALLRNAGKFLSSLVIAIGYISVLWDPLKQAWHDKWAKSFVLVRNR